MSKKKIDELTIMLTATDFSTKTGSVVVGRRFGKMMKLAGPIKFGDIQTATEMFRDAYFELMNDVYKKIK